MKYIKSLAILLLFIAANQVSAQTVNEWPQMKNFHSIMSRTFHPAEEGNLEPIKLRSEMLMQQALELTNKEIPKAFDTKEIKASIAKLQAKTKQVHEQVTAKAADADITKSLTEAHDIFHEIVGLCSDKK